MKRLLLISIGIVFLTLYSCNLINRLIPDVDTKITETYPVTIDYNVPVGVTDTIFVDVTTSEEYQQYSDRITGYEIEEITYEVLNYNGVDDLYFSGSVVCFDEEESTVVTIGEIERTNLSGVNNLDSETTVYESNDGYDQVLLWLDDPGNFNMKVEYRFSDSMNDDYSFLPEDIGTTFQLRLHFYVIVLTGL